MLMSFYADFQNVKNNQGKTALDILKLNNEFNENFLSRRPSQKTDPLKPLLSSV